MLSTQAISVCWTKLKLLVELSRVVNPTTLQMEAKHETQDTFGSFISLNCIP